MHFSVQCFECGLCLGGLCLGLGLCCCGLCLCHWWSYPRDPPRELSDFASPLFLLKKNIMRRKRRASRAKSLSSRGGSRIYHHHTHYHPQHSSCSQIGGFTVPAPPPFCATALVPLLSQRLARHPLALPPRPLRLNRSAPRSYRRHQRALHAAGL